MYKAPVPAGQPRTARSIAESHADPANMEKTFVPTPVPGGVFRDSSTHPKSFGEQQSRPSVFRETKAR